MNSTIVKIILLAAVALYVVSPVDAVAGPIDDLIVAALGILATKKLPQRFFKEKDGFTAD